MKVLQNDDNFFVAIVEHNGAPAILKRIQSGISGQRKQIFLNEHEGMMQFARLAREHPEWNLKVPTVYESNDEEVVRELIEGEELFSNDMEQNVAVERLKRLASLLAKIDTITPDPTSDDVVNNSAPYKNIRRRFDVWSKLPLETGLLTQKKYMAANQLIDEYESHLEPRYAHGDISPFKHVFITADNHLGLIDFEHYSAYKPRFYDVCYAYARLFTLAEDMNMAKELLRHFMSEVDDLSEPQLLAVMTQRAVGAHFDALNDYKKGEDYRERAKAFLDLCLSRDTNALL